jgi:hypothetical protein
MSRVADDGHTLTSRKGALMIDDTPTLRLAAAHLIDETSGDALSDVTDVAGSHRLTAICEPA